MSDFILITNRKQFYAEAEGVWADYSPNLPMQGFLNAPHEMPCLASIFVANGKISAVVADRKSAKRLIYPKTNRRRVGMRWFDWIDGGLDEEIETYVRVVLGRHKVDKESLLQAAYVSELMRKVKGRKGPVLVANRLYSFRDKMMVNFFLVTKELASSLVYYNKNHDKDEEAIVHELLDHDQAQPGIFDVVPEEPPVEHHISPENFPFVMNIDREGVMSVTTRIIFKTATNIPRFSDHKENDIAQWEAACIKDINVILKNSQVDVEGTISVAKTKCKEFLARRQLMRISWAAMYNEDWINKKKVAPEIRAIILQHDQNIHNRDNRRHSKWDQHSG